MRQEIVGRGFEFHSGFVTRSYLFFVQQTRQHTLVVQTNFRQEIYNNSLSQFKMLQNITQTIVRVEILMFLCGMNLQSNENNSKLFFTL